MMLWHPPIICGACSDYITFEIMTQHLMNELVSKFYLLPVRESGQLAKNLRLTCWLASNCWRKIKLLEPFWPFGSAQFPQKEWM
jgi:hypothetical protein